MFLMLWQEKLSKISDITGGTRGNVLACVKLFLKEGAIVILSDIDHNNVGKKAIAMISNDIPLKAMGTPDDVAFAAVYLICKLINL